MTLVDFYNKYDLWAWVFAVLSGIVCYFIIRFGERLLFLCRTRRRIKHLNVNCNIVRDQSNYPCKLWIDFRNWSNRTLLMKIEGYKLPKEIRPDDKAARDSTSGLLEIKFIEYTSQQSSAATMNVDAIIRHGEQKQVWVPLDPTHNDQELNLALSKGKIGKLKAEILWFGDTPIFRRYRPKIRKG
jgi:hypothetical protein